MRGLVRAYIARLKWDMKTIILYTIGLILSLTVVPIIVANIAPSSVHFVSRQQYEQFLEIVKRILGSEQEVPLEVFGSVLGVLNIAFMGAIAPSAISTITLSQLIYRDKVEGVFEVLLSGPISKRDLVLALLTYTLLTALVVQVLVIGLLLGLSTTTIAVLGLYLSVRLYFIKLVLALVPSVTVLSSLLTAMFSLPIAVEPRRNPLLVLPVLAVVMIYIAYLFNPAVDPLQLALYIAIACVVCSTILIALMPRVVREEWLIR
jgi:hypothetical protein